MSATLLHRTTFNCISSVPRLATSSPATFRKPKAAIRHKTSGSSSKTNARTFPSPNSKNHPQDVSPSSVKATPISSSSRTMLSKGNLSINTSSPPDDATGSPQTKISSSASITPPDQPFPAPYRHSQTQPTLRSPITNWVLASPRRTAVLLKMGDWLGYGSPKQVAARRSKIIYDVCCEVALGRERSFWYDILSLPPTFQSWFTITNLHVWLATVRLRALPPPHGRPYVQALIDHFFFDVEDRLRAVLGKKAPERLVTRHMKILREQWAGLGLACDHALITGEKDLASSIWRNLLGARAARGIAYADVDNLTETNVDPPTVQSTDQSFQRQLKLDPSSGGVSDFEGREIDKYVLYPELMLALSGYLRRELVRLEQVNDTVILGGAGRGMHESVFGPRGTGGAEPTADLRETFTFGRVKDAAVKLGVEIVGL